MNGFRIRRDLPAGRFPLHELAEGLHLVPSLVDYFGGERELRDLLSSSAVELESFEGYMWVNPDEDCLMISREYLQEADEVSLYLDMIHEVVHLRQLARGLELFDKRDTYDKRPTELEAYRVSLEEARRLRLSEEFLRDYLSVPWINQEQYERMLVALGVEPRPLGPARL